jgi:phosphoribosylaminoimidazole-succinocarboxamide synthase
MSSDAAVTKVDLSQYNIKKIASGKVREIFEIDDQTLLFVATDRISAYDVILNNVSILIPCRPSRCCTLVCEMR